MALLFGLIELLADAVPGIVIRLDAHVIAAAYFAASAQAWAPSPLHDQQLGGDLLWCIGEAIDVPFLAVLLMQWIRSDAREARHVDQILDASASQATGGDDDSGPGEGMLRP
jgi:putative copper resistance protein D